MARPATQPASPGTDTGSQAAAFAPIGASQFTRARLITIFVGLILGILMAVMDQTIVSTALFPIASALNGVEQLAWIITVYLLAQTVVIPLFGKLSDTIGSKRAFQLAILVFLAGSILAGLSQSMGMLIVFRAIQGLGAGGLLVGAQTIMGEIVTARERAKYMSVMGPMIGVGTVVGPLIGGYLAQYVSWRWLFYVNVPIGIAALVIVSIALRLPHRRTHQKLDLAGAATLTSAVVCLVLLLNWGGSRVPWDSLTIILLGASAAVLGGLFVLAERRAVQPVIPLRLFRDGVFRVNVPLAFLLGVAMFGAISFLPSFLQLSLGVSTSHSGLLLLPLMGGLMAAAVTIGQLMNRTGRYKIFPLIGAPLAAVGMFLLSLMSAQTSLFMSSVYMLVLGIGIGLIMPMLILTVQNSVPANDMRTATAGVNFFRQIGAALGVALIGSLFTSGFHELLISRLSPDTVADLRERLGGSLQGVTAKILETLPDATAHAYVTSTADALTPLFAYFAPALLVAFILAWFLEEKPLTSVPGRGPQGGSDDSESSVRATAATNGHQPSDTLSATTGNGNHRLVGSVYGADRDPVPAVVTLTDLSGRQVDRAHTDAAGVYRLSRPDGGSYLLVCSPRDGNGQQPVVHHVSRHTRTRDIELEEAR